MISRFLTALVAVSLYVGLALYIDAVWEDAHGEPADVANTTPVSFSQGSFGGSNVIAIARRSIGTNPGGQRMRW